MRIDAVANNVSQFGETESALADGGKRHELDEAVIDRQQQMFGRRDDDFAESILPGTCCMFGFEQVVRPVRQNIR